LDLTQILMDVSSNLYKAERSQRAPAPERDWGDWPWLGLLDVADRAQFIDETQQAIVTVAKTGASATLEQHLWEWRASAEFIADPTARNLLDGGFDDAEFVEVGRPDE